MKTEMKAIMADLYNEPLKYKAMLYTPGPLIYRIHNLKYDKSYIERTVLDLNSRLFKGQPPYTLRSESADSGNSLYDDIRAEGLANFEVSILTTDPNEVEFTYINKYDSYYNGYNDSEKGTGYDSQNPELIAINKLGDLRYINPSELDHYLDLGWELGLNYSSTYSRLWAVNEAGDVKSILPTEVETYHRLGYAFGRNWESATHFNELEEFEYLPELACTSKTSLAMLRSGYTLGIPLHRKGELRRVHRTSGTTGNSLYIPYNQIDLDAATEVGARCFRNAGVTPGMKVIHCLNYQMWSGGHLDSDSLQRAGACLIPYGTGGTKELIKVILDLKVEAISCTPSYLDKIKEVLRSEYGLRPIDLELKLGLFGGESGLQSPEFRNRIEKEWGFKAVNANYGSADTMSMFASENSETLDGLMFLADGYLTPELYYNGTYLPIDNPITDTGELVITTSYKGGLQNLIRYRMGDIIRLKTRDKNFKFEVIGRADEMLVIRGLNVYPSTINSVFQKCLMELGLSGRLQLHVSGTDPIQRCEIHTDVDNAEFIALLTSEVKKATSINFEVKVSEIVTGNTGKVKLVLRDL